MGRGAINHNMISYLSCVANKSNSRSPQRQCLFCENVANSNEHMWPYWMRSKFQRNAHDTAIETNHYITASGSYHPDSRPVHGHPTTRKVKAVCRPCNNGWMSALEDEAKPMLAQMLSGNRIVLDELAQRTLVDWVVMKMMVWEVTDDRGRVFTRPETLAFATSRTLPVTLRIWLFRTRLPNFAHITRTFTSLFAVGESIDGSVANIPNTQAMFFGVGQLVIWVVQSSIEGFDPIAHRQRLARPLWPMFRRNLAWPPIEALNASQMAHLATILFRFTQEYCRPLNL